MVDHGGAFAEAEGVEDAADFGGEADCRADECYAEVGHVWLN